MIDLSQVPHLGVTTAVAIESTVRDARAQAPRSISRAGTGQPRQRLEQLGLGKVLPADCWVPERADALGQALAQLAPHNGRKALAA